VSGRSGDVFRAPKRDRHGDPVESDGVTPVDLTAHGDAFLGTLTNIIMGGQSASPSMGRQESSDTTGTIGCRRDFTPKLKLGDRIIIDGVEYQCGPTEWDNDHSFTDSTVAGTLGGGIYWVKVSARIG
jgi:hypothetical protein